MEAMDTSTGDEATWTRKEEAAKLHIYEIRSQIFGAKPIREDVQRVLTNLPKDVNFLRELIMLDGFCIGLNSRSIKYYQVELLIPTLLAGIGFKSAFLVSSQPHIFSNGYHVRFQEEPDQDCGGVGYIVPQWVSGHLSIKSISDVYRLSTDIPSTTIILPLKSGFVDFVREQLCQLSPETLLFLPKLKQLKVRAGTDSSFRKEVDEGVVRLFEKKEDDSEESCLYYLWDHIYPVSSKDIYNYKRNLQDCVISIAFPLRETMRTATSVGIFAFLPTTMVTHFPFVIQADFYYDSSRDFVLFDRWNLGILNCIPKAFADAILAFRSHFLCDSQQKIFDLLPAQASSNPKFDDLRASIGTQLQSVELVPCEVFADMSSYARPQEVVRVCPEFRSLMDESKSRGHTSGFLPTRILLSSLDLDKNNAVLEFIGVKYADEHWYNEYIQSLCSSKHAKDGMILLLKIIKNLMASSADNPFLRLLKKIISKTKCLKAWGCLGDWGRVQTSYITPEECILYDSTWEGILDVKQMPSIDQDFYQRKIGGYKDQLRYIGVKVDPLSVCSLLSKILSEWQRDRVFVRPWAIVSIYRFMNKFQWRPEVTPSLIFTNNEYREWVPPHMCVFHGEEHLLGPRRYTLDHTYNDELLPLFCSGFGVKEKPSIDEYLDFLKETEEDEVALEDFYSSFWKSVAINWNPIVQKSLKEKMTQVPATKSTSDDIFMIECTEAFLADDLYLKKLFSSYDKDPLFVWCPRSDIVSPIRLHEIYESLGVRKVSKTVKRIEQEIGGAVEVTPIDGLINRGLIKIILGFLAGRQVHMSLEERQVAVSSVVELETCRIHPPYELRCQIERPKSPVAEVKEVKLVHWTHTSKKLFIDSTRYDNMKTDPELIAAFADELAQRLLAQTTHCAARKNLSLLIQFWFMMDFNERKVDDMLSRENLQLSAKDCEFVDAAKFASSIIQCPAPRKRSSMERDQSGPFASTSSGKKRR